MGGTFPSSPPPSIPIKITSHQPTIVSNSHNLHRSARATGAQRFSIQATWAGLTREQFAPIDAFLMSQGGQAGSFLFKAYGFDAPLGIATGTPVVIGASQVGTSLVTGGWTPSQTNILKAGDIITIAGQTKVYKVVADADSNSSGGATLSILPSLLVSPADAAVISVNSVAFTVAQAGDVIETIVGRCAGGYLFNFSLSMVEAF
ncbi:MAG: hypothetical protein H7839_04770 [Magnetococcus sp. YQC-5]